MKGSRVSADKKLLTRAGVFIALALVLEYLTTFIPRMPQGGKFISLGMIPIITFALMYGPRWGALMGAAFGLLYYPVDPFAVHWLQIILDYPLAFGCAGLAGFFRGRRDRWGILWGILAANTGRFICHYLSGVIFFSAYLPQSFSPWIGSLLYNGVYLIPTTAACWLLIPPILRRFAPEKEEN